MTNFENIKNILTGLLNTDITPEVAKDLYNKNLFPTCEHCIYYPNREREENECLNEENCNIGAAIYIQRNIDSIVEKLKDKKEADLEVYEVIEDIFDFSCYYCSYNTEEMHKYCVEGKDPCCRGHIKWLNQEIEAEE